MKKSFIIALLIVSTIAQESTINSNEDNSHDNNQPTSNDLNTNIPPNKKENKTNTPPFLNEKNKETNSQNQLSETTQISFKDLQYEFIFVVKPIDYVLYGFIVFSILLFIATIASFSKVPVQKGYRCRCCQRFKWFIIILMYLIFSPFLLIYYSINGIVGCLNGFFPDKRLEDCKLDEVPEPESPNLKDKKKKNEFYNDLVEEEQYRK